MKRSEELLESIDRAESLQRQIITLVDDMKETGLTNEQKISYNKHLYRAKDSLSQFVAELTVSVGKAIVGERRG